MPHKTQQSENYPAKPLQILPSTATGRLRTLGMAYSLSSCPGPPAGLYSFIGEWQGMSKDNKDTIVIIKADASLFISKGTGQKDTLRAIYDKESKSLRFYCISTSVIGNLEKSRHLSVNHGRDGEYERLRH